jgi:hypothetical protein
MLLLPIAGACANEATAPPSGTAPPSASIAVEIISPEQGATVSRPVMLDVRASGIEVAAASLGIAGAAHFHAFVDRDAVAEGEIIPSGAGIFHFVEGPLEVVPLDSGEHAITVVLGDNEHRRLDGVPAASVRFTADGAPTPVTPSGSPATEPTEED